MSENTTNIISKIEKYDGENKTVFAKIVREKLEKATKFDSAYYRGIVHGVLIILTSLGVVTSNEAIVLLEEVSPDIPRY